MEERLAASLAWSTYSYPRKRCSPQAKLKHDSKTRVCFEFVYITVECRFLGIVRRLKLQTARKAWAMGLGKRELQPIAITVVRVLQKTSELQQWSDINPVNVEQSLDLKFGLNLPCHSNSDNCNSVRDTVVKECLWDKLRKRQNTVLRV